MQNYAHRPSWRTENRVRTQLRDYELRIPSAKLTKDMMAAPSMVTPRANATLPFEALRILSLNLSDSQKEEGRWNQ